MSEPQISCILAFDSSNRLAVRRLGSKLGLAFTGADIAMATARLEGAFRQHTASVEYFSAVAAGRAYRVFFAQATGQTADVEIEFWSIDRLSANPSALAPSLAGLLPKVDDHLVEIPYLHLGENDFIYKFRPALERNTAIYAQDEASRDLYQSQLCTAIKALARTHERSAAEPVSLRFRSGQLCDSEPFRLLSWGEERHRTRLRDARGEFRAPGVHAFRADPQSVRQRGPPAPRTPLPSDRQGRSVHR
jgi:4-hydroxy-3-methylbut-2-enyl diphosphate reductase